jgi:hypothetical protein
MNIQFESGASVKLLWGNGVICTSEVLEQVGSDQLMILDSKGEEVVLLRNQQEPLKGLWYNPKAPKRAINITLIPRYYAIRLPSGWWVLEAQTFEACVRDIPNHNPDGEVLEVRKISKAVFDEYEEHSHQCSPDAVEEMIKYAVRR